MSNDIVRRQSNCYSAGPCSCSLVNVSKYGGFVQDDSVPTRGSMRQKMVAGATQVLARRGLHATAFSEVLALTGASRGSIYHHFPGGKAELIEAVLERHASDIDDGLRALHGLPVDQVVSGALDVWRARLVRDDCESGCPVAAVTIAADTSRAVEECRGAFRQWQDTLAWALRAAGCSPRRASDSATLLVAAVQGALILARAEGQTAPFDTVAGLLRAQTGEWVA